MIKQIFILTLCFIGLYCNAENNNPNNILESIKNNYLKIKDYSADINVNVQVDFIEIPDKSAKIYYKHPDKIKYKSDDFLLLPKKGFELSINELLKYQYSAIYIKKDTISESIYDVIKIIPHDTKSEIILATLWISIIDTSIYKIDFNTKKAGNFIINFYYNESKILPQQVKISFDVKNIEIPFSFFSSENMDILKQKDKTENTKGEITISYSNYKINKGIADSLFKE